jgi:hypothetical protein
VADVATVLRIVMQLEGIKVEGKGILTRNTPACGGQTLPNQDQTSGLPYLL